MRTFVFLSSHQCWREDQIWGQVMMWWTPRCSHTRNATLPSIGQPLLHANNKPVLLQVCSKSVCVYLFALLHVCVYGEEEPSSALANFSVVGLQACLKVCVCVCSVDLHSALHSADSNALQAFNKNSIERLIITGCELNVKWIKQCCDSLCKGLKSERLRASGGVQKPLSTITDIKVEIIPF